MVWLADPPLGCSLPQGVLYAEFCVFDLNVAAAAKKSLETSVMSFKLSKF